MPTEAVEKRGPSTARRWARGLLAGPVAFVASAVVMAGGALWLPKGAASIDNIVLPIVLFPAIWAAFFFYTSLDRNLLRAWLVTLGLLGINGGMIALEFVGKGAVS